MHFEKIEEYSFDHGLHFNTVTGEYHSLNPHDLGRPLSHAEMDYNLLYQKQTLNGWRIAGSNSDLTLNISDLEKVLKYHQVSQDDADWARYSAAGLFDGQLVWIPVEINTNPVDPCAGFVISGTNTTPTLTSSGSTTTTTQPCFDDIVVTINENTTTTTEQPCFDDITVSINENTTTAAPTTAAPTTAAPTTAAPTTAAPTTAAPTTDSGSGSGTTTTTTVDVRLRTLKLWKVINPWNEDESARCDLDETVDYWAEWPIGNISPSTGRYVSGTDGECYHVVEKYSYDAELPEGAELNLTLIGDYFGECDCDLPPTTTTEAPPPPPEELSHLVYATEFNFNGQWWSTDSYGPGVDPADSGQPVPPYSNMIYMDYYDNTDGAISALTFRNEVNAVNPPTDFVGWDPTKFFGQGNHYSERNAFKIQSISDLASFKYNWDSNITEFPLSVTPKTGLAYLGEGIGQLETGMTLYSSDTSGRPEGLPETGAILVSQTEGGRYSSDPNQTWELPQGSLVDEVKDMQQSANTLRYVVYENWVVKRIVNVGPSTSAIYPRLAYYDNRDWETLVDDWFAANPTCSNGSGVPTAVTNFIKDKLIDAGIALPTTTLSASHNTRHTLYLYVNVYGGTLDTALLEEFKIAQGC